MSGRVLRHPGTYRVVKAGGASPADGELLDESIALPKALKVVKQAKGKILIVEKLLPSSKQNSFRERVVERLERLDNSMKPNMNDSEFQTKTKELLDYLENQFGVNDYLEIPQVAP